MALGLTQPLTEVSAGAEGLTTLPLSCAECLEIWEPQSPGTLTVCPGLYWDCFTFTFLHVTYYKLLFSNILESCSTPSKPLHFEDSGNGNKI
jgi:hypothetical protein